MWNYTKIHCIETITKDIVEDLKTGNISFMIYGYPPAFATMKKDGVSNQDRKKQLLANYDMNKKGHDHEHCHADDGHSHGKDHHDHKHNKDGCVPSDQQQAPVV